MKGYKVGYGGKSPPLICEVGKTYTFHGETEMCKRGLHEVEKTFTSQGELEICGRGFRFCEEPEDILQYYLYSPKLKLFEIEASGECLTIKNKTVTDNIKIIKEVPLSITGIEVERTENGSKAYYKHKGYAQWCTYDSNANLVYCKNTQGKTWIREWWKEYDVDGNAIHYRDIYGNEWWKEYDVYGNEIHYWDNQGYEWWKEYDAYNHLIHYKRNTGLEWWGTYNKNINVFHLCNNLGTEEWFEYDQKDRETHYLNNDGEEWEKEYDKDDNLIYFLNNKGIEWSIEIT